MRLTDSSENPNRFTFPPGTILDPGKFLILFADRANSTPGIHLGFALDQDGDSLFLFDRASHGGQLLDQVSFGRQLPDRSIARVSGDEWSLASPTPGSVNRSHPIANPYSNLLVNEWLAAHQNANAGEFVELHNRAALPVALGELSLTDAPIGWPRKFQLEPSRNPAVQCQLEI